MLTLVAAVEAYERAREICERVSRAALMVEVAVDGEGRWESRKVRSLTRLEKDMLAIDLICSRLHSVELEKSEVDV